jgi:hypothetical protein
MFMILAMITLFSCAKGTYEQMTIVRDCSGTYLRQDGKDYHVCNAEKVSEYSNGKTLTVTCKQLAGCNNPAADQVTCKLFHYNEGWVEVVKVK